MQLIPVESYCDLKGLIDDPALMELFFEEYDNEIQQFIADAPFEYEERFTEDDLLNDLSVLKKFIEWKDLSIINVLYKVLSIEHSEPDKALMVIDDNIYVVSISCTGSEQEKVKDFISLMMKDNGISFDDLAVHFTKHNI
jgi:hypothetical protein